MNKVIEIRKSNVFRLGHLPLIKYYAPSSPILFEPINKVIEIRKSNVLRWGHLPLLKYYAPFFPNLLKPINKLKKYLSLMYSY